MAMTIQTNNAAITALKHLNTNSANMNKSLERLSSGFRINSASDDAAGYAISAKLSGQNSRMQAAVQNAASATAMVKMADAAVNEIQNMVVRVQSLATQAASANNSAEISKLEAERSKLETQIDKIANGTNYGGVNLLNGKDATSAAVAGTAATLPASATVSTGGGTTTIAVTGTATFSNAATFTVTTDAAGAVTAVTSSADLLSAADGTVLAAAGDVTASLAALGITLTPTAGATPAAGTYTFTPTAGTAATAAGQTAYTAALAFQVGADNNVSNQVTVDLRNTYTSTGLGLTGGATAVFTNQASAQAYIDTAQTALNTLVNQRADLGATQNQLTYVTANLGTGIEQVSSAISSIKDADMATEMANFTKNQIMVQAGTAMLAQANQASQSVMSLFR